MMAAEKSIPPPQRADMTSPLLEFYRGAAPDSAGRTLAAIWEWDDDRLEAVHNYIQWLFPLPEPSAFNYHAPLLTADDIAAFHRDAQLRANLRRSFERILQFFGLAMAGAEIVDGPNLAARIPDVWGGQNHNWLRITRVLRCVTLLGLPDEAAALFRWLERCHQQRRFPDLAMSFPYWQEAVAPPV